MQADFHFYVIYALARAAGMDPDRAFTVAYSSQHTDDAKYEHTLEFENGGRFPQVVTAHRFFGPSALTPAVCYRVWIPFHFLPGNVGSEFYERMVTRSRSVTAQRTVQDVLNSPLKPYSLHRLGIVLHLYADTWSHQNFLGLPRAKMNDVRNLRVKEESGGFVESLLRRLQETILEYAAPLLGHAQAGTIPDEPYREWEYEDYRGRHLSVSNHERALDAAQNCYLVLTTFVQRFPSFSSQPSLPWHRIDETVGDLLSRKGGLEERINEWKKALTEGVFGLAPQGRDANLDYDDREWFRRAVRVVREEGRPDRYTRGVDFESSHWKYFQDAAALHLFHLLHEVLPEYGMVCG